MTNTPPTAKVSLLAAGDSTPLERYDLPEHAEAGSALKSWDRQLLRLDPGASFLQSAGFGAVQALEGWRPVELLLAGGARALVLIGGPAGMRLASVRRGPVPATMQAMTDLVAWARASGIARLRVEPEAPAAFGESLRSAGWVAVPAADPVDTSVVALHDPDTMLAAFNRKHRYNIRLALRRGVTVSRCPPGEGAEELHRQHAATARRQHINPPSLAAYQRRLDHLAWSRIYVAHVEGEAVAAALVVRFGNRAVNLFAGSSGQHSNLRPTYAIQWTAMQEAWEAGCSWYDLWGIPPSDDPSHPWHGLWEFKIGFRGEMVNYCGSWEYAVRPLPARAARFVDSLRSRVRRGL